MVSRGGGHLPGPRSRHGYHRIGNKIFGRGEPGSPRSAAAVSADLAAAGHGSKESQSPTGLYETQYKLRPSPSGQPGAAPGSGGHAGPWAHPGILHSYASTPGAYDLGVGPSQNFGSSEASSKGQERIYSLGADFDPE
jgi:hypothetical protein